MEIDRKREKGITMVSLVVTIILLIILAAVSITATLGEDGIITIAKRAKENMEYAQIEEQAKLNELYEQLQTGVGDFNYDNIEKINDFKKAIADYIEEAGGKKPEYTAEKEEFGESIKGIVEEVTKNTTATEDKIVKNYTAYVKGKLVIGTMPDNGAINQTINAGGSYTIPAGYHNGEGKVTATSLSNQTSGTVTAGEILSGKTAWVNGSKVTGTMVNQGAKTATINAGQSYTIPAGYHNGSGKITAATLASQTGGTATADKILKDYTAYVNGQYIVGTMSNNGAVNKTLNAGQSYTILAGYHNGAGKITAATLESQTHGTAIAEDIEKGKIAWVNGKRVEGTKNLVKYYEPYIPTGFKYKEGTWNSGFTIIGDTENTNDEFVWVPCVTNQSQVRNGDTVVTFNRIYDRDCYKLYDKNFGVGIVENENIKYIGNADDGAGEIRTSVEKYGGFYIAKYEAKKSGEEILSQRKAELWTDITFLDALIKSKSMLNTERTGVKSTLISGEAWDTTLQWISYAADNEDGRYDESGCNELDDVACNVWNLARGVREITSERVKYYFTNDLGGQYIMRGGSGIPSTRIRKE